MGPSKESANERTEVSQHGPACAHASGRVYIWEWECVTRVPARVHVCMQKGHSMGGCAWRSDGCGQGCITE